MATEYTIYPDRVCAVIDEEGGSSGIASIVGPKAHIEVLGTGVMSLTIRTRQPGKAWVTYAPKITAKGRTSIDLPEEGRQVEVICDTDDYTEGELEVTISA